MAEIDEEGAVIPVEYFKEERWEMKKKGVSSQCLFDDDTGVLLQLRHLHPSRSNKSYVANIFRLTGTIISLSFVSEFFHKIGPYSGNFTIMNKVPIDKYKPSNIVTYADYLDFISIISPGRIKFGDEKSEKGRRCLISQVEWIR